MSQKHTFVDLWASLCLVSIKGRSQTLSGLIAPFSVNVPSWRCSWRASGCEPTSDQSVRIAGLRILRGMHLLCPCGWDGWGRLWWGGGRYRTRLSLDCASPVHRPRHPWTKRLQTTRAYSTSFSAAATTGDTNKHNDVAIHLNPALLSG